MKKISKKWIIIILILVAFGFILYQQFASDGYGSDFTSGNGRIEATEINISAKLAGRIEKINVDEGDFVTAGQPLVIMQTDTLQAQLNEAQAQHRQAMSNEATSRAQVALKMSDKVAALAGVTQRESDLDIANKHLERTAALYKKGAISVQQFDDDTAKVNSAKAALDSAKSQVTAADAAIEAAQAGVESAKSAINVALANINQIQADIDDSTLTAPVDGRIQYRIAQPGEVLPSGGKVLNLVNLSDVYLTFFLPEMIAGKVGIGDEVRLVLDALPNKAISAKISFVSSVAQFTPKTVETKDERQKLMFRVKAQLSPELLKCYITHVKTGLPGVAWVRLDPNTEWPSGLSDVAKCQTK
ncbi:HlyD family efflux transporter periplasmic adaptor subunit [Gilliamella sp. B2776]|uniref:HlyD family secretion protein n=1 Tax=unclassified Gilliamella TaxID=2685620 RepID=UPI002269E000|nr:MULTISPECIES: efflux RND transporter periplasmic adaptor subunit [unclassified Gilliamella]MCX8649631.1 HlyD family efflux transporter periplasmic adaptor subunit [Gilliamella sp. B2779]MCX8654851.1 HlyD family efflux transporter periplasmic adaptor subunit [Gilliamella sp. B2737]MCX8656935.1 HlyD family efflux transporter periplasmic adaptor subunit [Gilliamella sp. B2894]MCX8665017.1 HlyD family efflux transporter periplasmic adaptor subunit [Gilliamella sp. B2887]MCX8691379.1 HlyD family